MDAPEVSLDAQADEDLEYLRSSRAAPMDPSMPELGIVDLYAGCGGLSLGVSVAARRQGFRPVIRLAVDTDDDAASVYQANFGVDVSRAPVESLFDGDLGAELTETEEAAADAAGSVDYLLGGPPCQGHSDLNNHTRRNDPRNALYARMARAAEVLRPSVVLIENVPAARHDVAKVTEVTVDALRDAGYAVSEKVINLSRVGVPQRRRRHVERPELRLPDGEADFEAIRASDEYLSALAEVISLAAGSRVALMCSERDPRACHRFSTLAPDLTARGLDVRHVLRDGSLLALFI